MVTGAKFTVLEDFFIGWIEKLRMGSDPPAGEGPHGLPPPGGPADGEHGPQTPIEREMDISDHWGGAGDSGTIRDQGLNRPPLEHIRTIHCDSSYHGLMFVGGSEAGDVALVEIVGASCSRYPMDESGARGSRDGGRDGGGGVGGRYILGYGRVEGWQTTRGTREDRAETWGGSN